MSAGSVPKSLRDKGWMIGPPADLLVGCGLISVAVLGAYLVAGEALNRGEPVWLLPILALLISQPHYGGTLVRIYDSKQTIDQYRFFSVYLSALILAWFVSSLFVPLLGVWLVTLYLTWSPWHYSGQNYGLAVMFLRRRGIKLDTTTRHFLYASFVLSFAVTLLLNHAGASPGLAALVYLNTDIKFHSLAFPPTIVSFLYWLFIASYAVCLVTSCYRLLRIAPIKTLAPALLIMSLQIAWFIIPYSYIYRSILQGEPRDPWVGVSYVTLVALGHAAQYLWITTCYAKSSANWSGYTIYWLKVWAAGATIWTLPSLIGAPVAYGNIGLAGFGALVAATVNIHHFVLDGAIWKLRSGPIADILIRNLPASATRNEAAAGRIRKIAWTCCVGLLVVSIGITSLRTVVLTDFLKQGDVATASRVLDWLRVSGDDRADVRMKMAEALLAAGQKKRAKHEYLRAADAEPYSAAPLLALGVSISGENGNAIEWFERAVKVEPKSPTAHFLLGREYLKRGTNLDRAVEHLEMAHELRPEERRWKSALDSALARRAQL